MRHMSTRPAEKVDKDENKDQADKGRKTVSIAGQGAGSIVGFFHASRSLARFEIKRTRTGWWARYGGKDDTAGVYGHQQQPSSSTRIAHSLCEKVLMIILSHCADEKRGFRSVCWAQSFCEEQQKQ